MFRLMGTTDVCSEREQQQGVQCAGVHCTVCSGGNYKKSLQECKWVMLMQLKHSEQSSDCYSYEECQLRNKEDCYW